MENTNIHSSVYSPKSSSHELVESTCMHCGTSGNTCIAAYLFESVVILSLLVVHYISKDLTDYTRICDTYLSEP